MRLPLFAFVSILLLSPSVLTHAEPAADLKAANLNHLLDVTPIGWLKSTNPKIQPHQLLSAKPCEGPQCKEERRLYLVRADGKKVSHFVYPGKIVDNKNTKKSKAPGVTLLSRAFYGRCLDARFADSQTEAFVVFQQERVDRKAQLQASVFIATPGELIIHDRLIEKGLPKINFTLAAVKQKKCFEISGQNRLVSQLVVNLNPSKDPQAAAGVEADDETDEPTKENNTDKDLTPASVPAGEPANGT